MKKWGGAVWLALPCILIYSFLRCDAEQPAEPEIKIFGPPAPEAAFSLDKSDTTDFGNICLNAAYNSLAERNYLQSIEYCKEALKYSPHCWDYESHLSFCLNEAGIEQFKKKNYLKALQYFEKASFHKVLDVNTKYNISESIKKLGLNSNSRAIRINLAEAALKRKDELGAIVQLREAVSIESNEKLKARLESLEKKNNAYVDTNKYFCFFANLNQAFYRSLERKITGAWADKTISRKDCLRVAIQKDSKTGKQKVLRVYSSGNFDLEKEAIDSINLVLPLDFYPVEYYGQNTVFVTFDSTRNANNVLKTKEIEKLEKQKSLCLHHYNKGKTLLKAQKNKAASSSFKLCKSLSLPMFTLLLDEQLSDCKKW